MKSPQHELRSLRLKLNPPVQQLQLPLAITQFIVSDQREHERKIHPIPRVTLASGRLGTVQFPRPLEQFDLFLSMSNVLRGVRRDALSQPAPKQHRID